LKGAVGRPGSAHYFPAVVIPARWPHGRRAFLRFQARRDRPRPYARLHTKPKRVATLVWFPADQHCGRRCGWHYSL